MVKNQLLFKGVLRPIVLSVFLESKGMYGYYLIKHINEISSGHLMITEGALYPLLSKLEEEGIIIGEIEKISSRKKKLYMLTEDGEIKANTELDDYRKFIKTLNNILLEKENLQNI